MKKKTKVINIRLTEEERREIDSLSKLMETTRTELLLIALTYFKAHLEEVKNGKR
jgi:uncharacterized protein (DUF1778 family)